MDAERDNDAWTREYYYTAKMRDAGGHVAVEIVALVPARDGNDKILPVTDPRNADMPERRAFMLELPGVRRHSQVANEFHAHFNGLVTNAMGEYPDYRPLTPERLATMLFGFTIRTRGFVRPHIDGPKDLRA